MIELDRLLEAGVISPLDYHFGRLLKRIANGADPPSVPLAGALVSRRNREGHVCIPLDRMAGRPLIPGESDATTPLLAQWREDLQKSKMVGAPGEFAPLIADPADRIYLYRYWRYQDRLVQSIRDRLDEPAEMPSTGELTAALDRFFSPDPEGIDGQRAAARTALTRGFCVISGGPGTGKTTTVAKILALLAQLGGNGPPAVALAAPTGKAAARLQESIRNAEAGSAFEPVRDSIPETAATVHRLLGAIPDSPDFRHHRDRPLSADVVVVDESSMVDLALMSKLAQALKPSARLILLGDRDQLASVEAGAVLGDICNTGGRRTTAPIADSIVHLKTNYRFGDDSGIGATARAINDGDAEAALETLRDPNRTDTQWRRPLNPRSPSKAFVDAVRDGFRSYLSRLDRPDEALAAFDGFRILCALRRGPFGAPAVNTLVEKILADSGLIRPSGTWYPGRPVMITRNDYPLRLFNGDIGITAPDPEAGGDLRVWLPAADGGLRKLHPRRLPEHETVYAMTVHKSQGSELSRVMLILPDRPAPVLTRELLYTGITRAREQVEIHGGVQIFRQAVANRIERSSGLRDALWGESM